MPPIEPTDRIDLDRFDPEPFDPDREAVVHFRHQLQLDQRWATVAGLIIVVLAGVFRSWWLLIMAALIASMTLVRRRAFSRLDRGDLAGAVLWSTAGSWGVTLGVVAILPEAFPIMVVNLIIPLIAAALNLSARRLGPVMAAGVVVAVLLGLVGYRGRGVGLLELSPVWFTHLALIAYLAGHVVVIGHLVRETNRTRLAAIGRIEAANSEIRRSRARVVAAADRERERIERNIHDGAQQRLVALAVRLRLAADLTEQGRPATAEQLAELTVEAREAIDELRELARGIYPAVLTERGLAEALQHLARTATNPVRVTCDEGIDLQPKAAATVYFICAEALQNAAKHAGPDASVEVSVAARDGDVVISVADDGPGFEVGTVASSNGLVNMADRAAAAGGSLEVRSEPGKGTRVDVVVPSRAVP